MTACSNADDTNSVSSDRASQSGAGDKTGNVPTVIYLARHGETWLNALDLVQGWSDSPLTDEGIEQASALGCGFAASDIAFEASYSADMVRHFETAAGALAAANSRLVPERDSRLREISFGEWEGKVNGDMWTFIGENLAKEGKDLSDATISEIFDTVADSLSGEHIKAETTSETAERMVESLLEIAEKQENAGGGNVLVVSSGISIRAALELLETDPGLLGTGAIPNGGVTTLVFESGKLKAIDVNDTGFMELCGNSSQSE